MGLFLFPATSSSSAALAPLPPRRQRTICRLPVLSSIRTAHRNIYSTPICFFTSIRCFPFSDEIRKKGSDFGLREMPRSRQLPITNLTPKFQWPSDIYLFLCIHIHFFDARNRICPRLSSTDTNVCAFELVVYSKSAAISIIESAHSFNLLRKKALLPTYQVFSDSSHWTGMSHPHEDNEVLEAASSPQLLGPASRQPNWTELDCGWLVEVRQIQASSIPRPSLLQYLIIYLSQNHFYWRHTNPVLLLGLYAAVCSFGAMANLFVLLSFAKVAQVDTFKISTPFLIIQMQMLVF
jgi:hypothetical protein